MRSPEDDSQALYICKRSWGAAMDLLGDNSFSVIFFISVKNISSKDIF